MSQLGPQEQGYINPQQQQSYVSEIAKRNNIEFTRQEIPEDIKQRTLEKYGIRSTVGERRNYQQTASANNEFKPTRSYTPNSYVSGGNNVYVQSNISQQSNITPITQGDYKQQSQFQHIRKYSNDRERDIAQQLVSSQPPEQYQQYSSNENKPKIVISQDGKSTVFTNEVIETKKYYENPPHTTQQDRSQSYVPSRFINSSIERYSPYRKTYNNSPTEKPVVYQQQRILDNEQVVYKLPFESQEEDVKEDYAVCSIF